MKRSLIPLLALAAILTPFAREAASPAGQRPPKQAAADTPDGTVRDPKHLLESAPAGAGEAARAEPKLTPAQAGRVAQVTGTLLAQAHYKQEPLDDGVSRQFFTNYLTSLDYMHMVFTQADVDEFGERFAAKLDDFTRRGDAGPAYEIFQRFLTRLEERVTYAQSLLGETPDFALDESFTIQRDKLPWPADRAAAEELWRKRVKYDLLQGRLAKDKPEDVVKSLGRRYQRLLKTTREFDEEEVLSIYLTALTHSYDPHSDYMSPTEASNFEISSVKLQLSGIGALLEWDDGYTRIKSLVPGGPAERSKQLKAKDRVVAVAQGGEEPVDVVEMRLNKVVELIRGKKGSEVRLTVVPASTEDGSRRVISMLRDDIKLSEQFAKARIVDLPAADGKVQRLGVITLPQFYENCARDVRKLIEALKKEHIEGLVLDLRRNGGGILDEAIELTGLFIGEGPVTQVKDARGRNTVLKDEDDGVAWSGPLVVAVGHLSASASEIVAAALQDYGRALVVGDSATHGKGTVQTLVSLQQFIRSGVVENPGKLKFTVSKFYRVEGGTTQKHGVTPDLALPSVLDYLDLGESHLPNALAADRTAPAEHERLDLAAPYLSGLRERSEARVGASRDFAYVREDIELLKKRREDKSVSLNEAKRLAERDEVKARSKVRREERKARTTAAPNVFELTLENLDAGRPPVPFAEARAAENKELAAADPDDAEEESDGSEESAERPLDIHIEETVRILGDYIGLLGPRGERLLTQKPGARD
ncbi:MAG: carboxy terminal-processing peptidase [Limisphaerales bacterium]